MLIVNDEMLESFVGTCDRRDNIQTYFCESECECFSKLGLV